MGKGETGRTLTKKDFIEEFKIVSLDQSVSNCGSGVKCSSHRDHLRLLDNTGICIIIYKCKFVYNENHIWRSVQNEELW